MDYSGRVNFTRIPVIIRRWAVPALTALFILVGCSSDEDSNRTGVTTIIFKHGKIAGDPQMLADIIDQFEAENPNIRVKEEALPASTDEQHQFYVINLGAGSMDFDVLSVDVIWVTEFARAGWLRDISHLIPEAARDSFFSGPIEAVTYQGDLFAVPWYIDAGLLYYRRDLLEKHGFAIPQTWDNLISTAQAIMAKEDDLYGFIWQGKQYEGLVCNALEFMWSYGGDVLKDGKVAINSPGNVAALQLMRDLIVEYHVSPELVTTIVEEPSRHIFGNGRALFLRNWPYAWNIFQADGSLVRGKIGVSRLPAAPGHESASTLGGWQLGVNSKARHPEAAEKLIEFLTSARIQKRLALTVGYKPTRKSLYIDDELLDAQPFFGMLYDVFTHARPRPPSPDYMRITQILQSEFSAVVAGIKSPVEALEDAQEQLTRVLQAGE